jgi:hypothetical protein
MTKSKDKQKTADREPLPLDCFSFDAARAPTGRLQGYQQFSIVLFSTGILSYFVF